MNFKKMKYDIEGHRYSRHSASGTGIQQPILLRTGSVSQARHTQAGMPRMSYILSILLSILSREKWDFGVFNQEIGPAL